MRDVVINSAVRTAIGNFLGALSSFTATELGGKVIEEAVRRSRIDKKEVDEVIMGNVLPFGLGQNPVRQAMIKAGLPMTGGAITVNKEWQPLEEIVGVVLNRLGNRLNDHPVTVKLPGNLPLIPFDGLLLEQVLMNLFDNAIKYAPKGTPLELSASEDFYTVTVALADRGPGIPPGEEEHIFDKFVRGRSTTGGVGLGLAICRTIINAHGGKIWAENREGGGAVFRFTLSSAGLGVFRCHRKILLFSIKKMQCEKQNELIKKSHLTKKSLCHLLSFRFFRPGLSFRAID